jgi:hypothetical protein
MWNVINVKRNKMEIAYGIIGILIGLIISLIVRRGVNNYYRNKYGEFDR